MFNIKSVRQVFFTNIVVAFKGYITGLDLQKNQHCKYFVTYLFLAGKSLYGFYLLRDHLYTQTGLQSIKSALSVNILLVI